MNDPKVEKQKPVPPFVQFCCAAIPQVFDDSLSYYEALCAMWKYLDETVKVINNNALVTEEFIEKFEELKKYVDEYFDNLDIQEEINNKLDAMVEDGSLQQAVINYIYPTLVTPEMYGAAGDGVADDTVAVQTALNYAKLGKTCLITKTYKVSTVTIKNGTKAVIGNGTIKGDDTSVNGIVYLGEESAPLKNCKISINVDLSAGEQFGINGYSVENCIFENCNIYGGTEKEGNTYYLRIVESIKNRFINNNFTAPTSPSGGNHYLLIFSVENPEYLYGGIFDDDHTIHYESKSNVDNYIEGNNFVGGTHAIVLGWSLRNTVTGNNFKYQSHRGVAIQNACSYNKVCNNQFEGILSSGVLMTYGCSYNDIIGNTFIDNLEVSPTAVGQGVICGYLHVMYNRIADNIIMSGRLYGVQLSVDVIGNTIENNEIGNYYLTGIYLNSDLIPTGYVWSDDFPIPEDAKFTRVLSEHTPFTDSEGTTVDYVGYYNSEQNVIQNNVFRRSIIDNSTACIYLTQMGNRLKLQYNTIQNNTYDAVQSGKYYFYLYEETTSYCIHNSLLSNTINGDGKNINRFYMTSWRSHFDNIIGNDILNIGMRYVTGATIDGYYGEYYKLSNSSATTLTSISNTKQDDQILLRLDANTTIQHASGGNLRLKGSSNISPQNNNAMLKLLNVDGSTLVEMWRSF